MTQTLLPRDLLFSAPGQAGSWTLDGGPSPAATSRGRSKAPAADALAPAFMRDPQLAPRLVRLAERSGLLPPAGQDVRRMPFAALRALQSPGQVQESLRKLEALTSRRKRSYLQQLAVHEGLLPKPAPVRSPSPLGPQTERQASPPPARNKRTEPSPVRLLAHGVLSSKIAALAKATPGEAARSLLDADFETALRRHAIGEGKMLLLPQTGPRYLLVRVPNPNERAAAQARLDRLDHEDLVARYDLIPYAAAQTPAAAAPYAAGRFNTYAVADVDIDAALRMYSWEEREGMAGLLAALALNFDPARAGEAAELKDLLATQGALPRLVAKQPTVAGVRKRLTGHNPVVLYADTPQARAHFAAQDAAEARATRLRLNLDTGGPEREETMRPMLGFAEQT